MNEIQLTPENVAAITKVCSAYSVDNIIVRLQYAEESMQKVAYEDETGRLDYLFRSAYDLKVIREQFEELEKTLGYENDRD